ALKLLKRDLGFRPHEVTGLFNTPEVAQEYVLTGVGLLAGSTIFLLTLLWGTCIIIGSQKFSSESGASTSVATTQCPNKKFFSFLTGSGVTTDPETSTAAQIMLLSLIPFLFLLIPKLFGMTYAPHGYIFLIALPVSVTFLLVYFIYQVFEPSIQTRRLSYVKHERLVIDILKHLQDQIAENILTEDGSVNLPAIKSLFKKIDQDGDDIISFFELKELLKSIKFRQLKSDKQKTFDQLIKEFDSEKMNYLRFTEWLDEAKNELSEVVKPLVQTKRKKDNMTQFYKEDGTPDISAIKRG
nr:sodium/calcium exchanger NCL2-like [Tanacetum cinerariifolium]